MSSKKLMPKKGVYTLIVNLVSDKEGVKIGKLGKICFNKGYYAYTGSALGKGEALLNRILRHIRKKKRIRWHIDYLLKLRDANIVKVIVAESNKKIECDVNKEITKIKGSKPVAKFGASDCKKKCEGHLIYLSNNNLVSNILSAYKKAKLQPITFDVKNRNFK